MLKRLQNVGSDLRLLLQGQPPPAHYIERAKLTTILPWHVRMFGSSPWSGSIRKIVLTIALLVIAGSAASVFYSLALAAQERSFAAGLAALHSADYKKAKEILERSTR